MLDIKAYQKTVNNIQNTKLTSALAIYEVMYNET